MCKRKGFERGPWYEIKCVKDCIISKEAKGQDASFERELLEAWSKYEGYEEAKETLSQLQGEVAGQVRGKDNPSKPVQ